jgi:hypothetical protein
MGHEFIPDMQRQNHFVGLRPYGAYFSNDICGIGRDIVEVSGGGRVRYKRPAQKCVTVSILLMYMHRLVRSAAMPKNQRFPRRRAYPQVQRDRSRECGYFAKLRR